MLLGPDPLGSFIPIAVKSIHRKRMPVKEVRGGQTASFALKKVCSKNIFSSYGEPGIIFFVCLLSELLVVHKKNKKQIQVVFPPIPALSVQIKRSSIRKGMVMVSPKLCPLATWEFEAEILVLHHPTTISPRYQAMGGSPYADCKESNLALCSFGLLPCRSRFLRLSPEFLYSSVSRPHLLLSALRQHKADGHHLVHEQRLPTDRGQSLGPLPLHQDSRVPALRPEAGVQRGTHQGGRHHH